MEILAMALVSGLIWAVTPSKTYYNTQYDPVKVQAEADKACGQSGFLVYPKGFLWEGEVKYFKCKSDS